MADSRESRQSSCRRAGAVLWGRRAFREKVEVFLTTILNNFDEMILLPVYLVLMLSGYSKLFKQNLYLILCLYSHFIPETKRTQVDFIQESHSSKTAV